jgi:hypothetical protein
MVVVVVVVVRSKRSGWVVMASERAMLDWPWSQGVVPVRQRSSHWVGWVERGWSWNLWERPAAAEAEEEEAAALLGVVDGVAMSSGDVSERI